MSISLAVAIRRIQETELPQLTKAIEALAVRLQALEAAKPQPPLSLKRSAPAERAADAG